jgi:hypothetical protein
MAKATLAKASLRREIKKAIDRLPDHRLSDLANYIAFLNWPPLKERIDKAEREIKAERFVDWRKIPDNV